jgi:cathepsin L
MRFSPGVAAALLALLCALSSFQPFVVGGAWALESSLVTAEEIDTLVARFVKEFRGGAEFPAEEARLRRELIARRALHARKHNANKGSSYRLAELNQFSAHTEEELNKMKNPHAGTGARIPAERLPNRKPYPVKSEDIDLSALPTHVDWRDHGVVTPVKNQGDCGSCWTFGTAETIESQYAIKTKTLFTLSEEQIVECVPNPDACGGNGGCKGGTVQLAVEHLMKMGGITTEWMYPYSSYFGTTGTCKFTNKTKPVVNLTGYYQVPHNEYAPLMHAIANMGPTAISVDASTWSTYEGGVYDGCNQKSPTIDHSVVVVGYGEDPQHGPYWLVRNSWGPTWGEKGYIRLKRSTEWNCGWDDHQSEGDECKNGPIERVCGTCGIWLDNVVPIVEVRQ